MEQPSPSQKNHFESRNSSKDMWTDHISEGMYPAKNDDSVVYHNYVDHMNRSCQQVNLIHMGLQGQESTANDIHEPLPTCKTND